MTSKFIIDIPEGTTKLDLRPILIPIVRGLLTSNQRWDNHITRKQVEEWIERAFATSNHDDRILRLKQSWLIAYAEAHNWKKQERYSLSTETKYEKERPTPEREPDRSWWPQRPYNDRHFRFVVPDSDSGISPRDRLRIVRSSLRDARHADGLSLNEILDEIEGYGPPLLQLAKAAR